MDETLHSLTFKCSYAEIANASQQRRIVNTRRFGMELIETPIELGAVTEETKGTGGSDYEFNPSGCEANKTWWGNEC